MTKESTQVTCAIVGGDVRADLLIECDHSDCILLPIGQKG
jgi:hypothetical protein